MAISFQASSACIRDPNWKPGKDTILGERVIQWENDVYAINHGSDQAYTNGLRYSYAWSEGCEWDALFETGEKLAQSSFGKKFKLDDSLRYTMNTEFGIGQHIFTPNDLTESELIEDDRPYGGYTYGTLKYTFTEDYIDAASGNRRRPFLGGSLFGQVQHSLEFQLGVVGPLALAGEAQTWVHELPFVTAPIPEGWDNQLPNELGIFSEYTGRYRLAHTPEDSDKVDFDLIPYTRVAIGNIQDYAAIGATVRYGKNITGFQTVGLSPTGGFGDIKNLKDTVDKVCGLTIFSECYIFAGAEVRYVAHNIFLDGSLFQDSHSVDKEPVVLDLSVGWRIRFRAKFLSNLTMDYAFIRRGKEFSPVASGSSREDGSHDYGVITFRWSDTSGR